MQQRTPKLSVVTVCYNDLKSLISTVASVEAQRSMIELEHVVIDGGSTDGTVEYLNSLNFGHLRWFSEVDDGIFDAFNKGIEKATGEWVHLLNAGDTYLDDLTWKYDWSADIDFLCFAVWKRKKIDYIWWPKMNINSEVINVAHPGLIVRRSAYVKLGVYDTNYQFVSDSKYIWDHVKDSVSIVYPIILVDMPDGGYSTNFALRHEFEKCLLVCSVDISLLTKIKFLGKICLAFFPRILGILR